MANENLIATVNDKEKFYKLKNLIGQTMANDGEAIATATEGLFVEGSLMHGAAYRFFGRYVVDNSEVEIVARPTNVEGTQMEILAVNAYGVC